jgi:hypothetical protein
MAVSKPVSGSPVVNDGGSLIKANGKGPDSPVTKALSVADVAMGNPVTGSKMIEDAAKVVKANTSGSFAFTPAKGADFLLAMAGPNAENINGVSSSVLSVGGNYNSDSFDGINELSSTRDAAGNLVDFGNDEAATPSRAVPGELVFMAGGKKPVTNAYKAQDSAE